MNLHMPYVSQKSLGSVESLWSASSPTPCHPILTDLLLCNVLTILSHTIISTSHVG